MKKIKIILEPVVVRAKKAVRGTHSISTSYNATIIVDGKQLITFDNDGDLAQSREWINRTFAPQKVKKLKDKINVLIDKLAGTFLIPVEVEDSTS